MALTLSDPRVRRILSTVGAGIGFFIWAGFFFIPQCRVWAAGRSSIISMKQRIGLARQELTQLPGAEEELAKQKAQAEIFSAAHPPEEQLPELLEMIAQAARASQVKLILVKPKENLSQLSPSPTGFLEMPIQVEAVGGYHPIGKFLDALERSESLIRLQELKIQANPKDVWNHQTTLTFQVYLLPAAGDSKK
ncbi:MAG: type 4a pilus biogenesis protein PilO [Candidatus Omnitrophica bacterium]|nr:type 4a pilus biogenesis protein PilO [Candidatus Omnitrophota bacterium]